MNRSVIVMNKSLLISQSIYNVSIQCTTIMQFLINIYQYPISASLLWQMLKQSKQQMSEQQEQIFLRADLHELSNSQDNSNFNVRKFKKSRQAKPIKVVTQNGNELKMIAKLHTEPASMQFTGFEYQAEDNFCSFQQSTKPHNKSMTNTFNSIMKRNDTFIEPELSSKPKDKKAKSFYRESSSLKHKQLFKSAQKKSKLQISGKLQGKLQVSQKANPLASQKSKFEISQKKINAKGPLQAKHIQNWLNNILIEYCHEEYFDKSITNSALKKFYIDENSLLSKGVKPQDVTRIYKSFFVYGIGFNNLLKEVSNQNIEVMKSVWKVYALMLEYCAAGNFETLVGEIERDKLKKISELETEVEKRQNIIEKNEELNEIKNNQIFREIKRLREENANLKNEKSVLQEEFAQTDQAFNEEVVLRLKFQSKINEVYGVHRQLGMKHHKLYEDFNKKIEELRKTSDRYFEVTTKYQESKQNLIELKQDYFILKKSSSHDKEHVSELIKEKMVISNLLAESNRQLAFYQSLAAERELKMNQFQIEKDSIQSILQLRQKSAKQTHNEYQLTLQENNRLYIIISDQRKKMEDYESDKKDFNKKIIKILSESSFYQKKLEESQKKNEELLKKYHQIQQANNKLSLTDETHRKELESYRMDLEANYKNIASMHKRNFELEEELEFLRKYERNMSSLIAEKDSKIAESEKALEAVKIEMEGLTESERNLASRLKITQNQLKIQKQNNEKIMQKMMNEKELLESMDAQKYNLLKATQMELDKYKQLFNDCLTNFKNEKFERNTLNANYLQSLRIVENKAKEIKQLDREISRLKEQINESRNKHQMIELNMFKLVSDFGLLQEKLERTMKEQKAILDFKINHVHPMIYEDLVVGYDREVRMHSDLKLLHKKTREELEDIIEALKRQIVSLKEEHELKISQLKNDFEYKLQTKAAELQYERENVQTLRAKVDKLQELAQIYKKKINERTTSERQELYRFMVEEKKKIIQTMQNHLDELQDALASEQLKVRTVEEQCKFELDRQIAQFQETALKTLRNKYESEYEQKVKDALRSCRGEIMRKEKEIRESIINQIREKSLQEIIQIKELELDTAIKQLANKSTKFKGIENFRQGRNGFSQNQKRSQLMKSSEESKRRNEISKKIKHAYDYYN